MNNYNIKVVETYIYDINIEADNEKDALKNAKLYYKNDEENEGLFIADATSFDNVKFRIVKIN